MDYIKIAKKIRAHYATVKFWYAAWKKEKDVAIAAKMRSAIAEVKEMIANAFAIGCDIEDRSCFATMNKDILEVQESIGDGEVVYAL